MSSVRKLREDEKRAIALGIFDYVKTNNVTDLTSFYRGITHFIDGVFPLTDQPHDYYKGYRYMRGK